MKRYIAGVVTGVLLSCSVAFAVSYTATDNSFPIQLNGENIEMEGYNINDSTYFKLRDIADKIGGFSVDFQNNTIQLAKGGYVYDNEPPVNYSKYIGSFQILTGETYNTLTITELNADNGVFYFDSVSLKRIYLRGPFNASFTDKNTLTGVGQNSYYGIDEEFSLIFSGDKITVKSQDSSWEFDINSDAIPMIDVAVDR